MLSGPTDNLRILRIRAPLIMGTDVMSLTDRQQIVGVMPAALRSQNDVMNVRTTGALDVQGEAHRMGHTSAVPFEHV
tara:strand:+ start:2836 stop:3066 length:231 start_codon:yes stop_codon:yes gene_type:complete